MRVNIELVEQKRGITPSSRRRGSNGESLLLLAGGSERCQAALETMLSIVASLSVQRCANPRRRGQGRRRISVEDLLNDEDDRVRLSIQSRNRFVEVSRRAFLFQTRFVALRQTAQHDHGDVFGRFGLLQDTQNLRPPSFGSSISSRIRSASRSWATHTASSPSWAITTRCPARDSARWIISRNIGCLLRTKSFA